MKIMDDEIILMIGAHPDDIEFGCGAIISKLKNKKRIICLTLSKMTNHKRTIFLVDEHRKSMEFLGITKENDLIMDFEERMFYERRQDICDVMYDIYKQFNPSIIFCHPVYSDLHQDHEIVAKECLRIFRETTVFGYQNLPRYYYNYSPNVFFEVSKKDVYNKTKALEMYETYKDKNYFNPKLVESQLRSNGVIIGVEFAEAYHTSKLAFKG